MGYSGIDASMKESRATGLARIKSGVTGTRRRGPDLSTKGSWQRDRTCQKFLEEREVRFVRTQTTRRSVAMTP